MPVAGLRVGWQRVSHWHITSWAVPERPNRVPRNSSFYVQTPVAHSLKSILLSDSNCADSWFAFNYCIGTQVCQTPAADVQTTPLVTYTYYLC